MENLKRMIKKVMIFLLIFALCVPAMELNNAQAAKLSSRKVDKLYSNALNKWISHPKRMKITDDLRARSGWNYNDTGKKVDIHRIYCSDMSMWMKKDLNADGIPEYLAYLPQGHMLILTIYKNKVKVLGVIQTTSWVGPSVYYNKKTNTFTITATINARTVSRNVYKIRKGKMYRVATLSDYVGMVMNINGYQPIYRYLNGKKVSKKRYYKYYNKYCKKMKYIKWTANQG